MYKFRVLPILLIVLFVSTLSIYATAAQNQIEIKIVDNNYEITIPSSQLILSIPKGGLITPDIDKFGAADNPRYFYLADTSGKLIISGWFEPDRSFTGVKNIWEQDSAKWSQDGLPPFQNVLFTKIENWDVVIYDINVPNISNSHIRAHWVQAGTWIDIHLSYTIKKSNQDIRTKLQDILKTIQVKRKPL